MEVNSSMKRVLLALIPVALLATASLAISGITPQPFFVASTMPDEEAASTSTEAMAPRVPSQVTVDERALVAQNPSEPDGSEWIAQAGDILPPEEPLPELVVDKTSLTQAMADVLKAIEQAKLAVTALDADSQKRYIQETVNFLAGAGEPNFRLVAQSGNADTYKGVRTLLVQARVVREAAEVQWIAAVQRQMEARAKKLAEIAQAGSPDGTVPPPTTSNEIASTVGPTGVLGTRGMRVEEQAHDQVNRAIRLAVEALSSDEPTEIMEKVTRILETARKIVQIAQDR
jgi:hypothetical protein